MIDIQTVLTYLTLISIPIGVVYHIMTLNNTRKNQQLQLETRQATLWMQLYSRYSDLELARVAIELLVEWSWTDFDDFIEKYGQFTNPDAYSKFLSVDNYFEGIGMLVSRELIEVEMVDDLMWSPITEFWEKFGPMIVEMRKRTGMSRISEFTELLYDSIQSIEK